MNKKLIAITLSTLVLVGGITGCSNKSTSTSSDSTKTEQSADKPLKLDLYKLVDMMIVQTNFQWFMIKNQKNL